MCPDLDSDVDDPTDLLARATATIDAYLGYTFEVAASPAARTFYGTGTHLLQIDWTDDTIDPGDVTGPNGWTPPTFVEKRNTATGTLYLNVADTTGVMLQAPPSNWWNSAAWSWVVGVPYTITKAWGHAAIPGDIKDACIIIATARWRESYAAAAAGDWRSQVGLDFTIPPNAKAILDRRLRVGVS